MKKNLLIPLVLSVSGLLALSNIKTITTHAEGETKTPSVREEIAYYEDFSDFEVGMDGEDIYSYECGQNLIWTGDSVYAEVNSNYELEYLIQDVDTYGYSRFGAFGTEATSNLCGLDEGKKYTFSVKVDLSNTINTSKLYFEYQNTDWCGVCLHQDGSVETLGTAQNAKYVNGVLSYDFIAKGECLLEGKEQYPYIKMTGQTMGVGDKVVVDDFKIVRNRKQIAFAQDFEGFTVGQHTEQTNNVWNGTMTSITIAEQEGGNKYLKVHKDVAAAGAHWENFYFNKLPLIDNKQYRLSFDVVDLSNTKEFYVRYNDNVNPCASFNKTTCYAIDEYDYIKGATFDGTHVTFDFVPSSTVNASFWNQVYFVVYNDDVLDFGIDNVVIELMDESLKPTFECEDFDIKLNDADYINSFDVDAKLVYGENDVRYLYGDELIINEKELDITKEGEYEITLKVIDESLNEYTKDVTVTVKDYVDEWGITPNLPNVVNYGEELDATAYKFVFDYASGKHEEVNITAEMISGFDSTTLGSQEVVIEYDNYMFYVDIEVVDYIVELTITEPTKTVYEQGDSLSLIGLKVETTTASGVKSELRSSDYTVSSFDSSTAGIKTITIKVGELTKTFEVTVNEKQIEESSSSSEVPSPSESGEPTSSSSKSEEKATEGAKKGCGSAAIPSIIGLLSIAGALLVSKKRR